MKATSWAHIGAATALVAGLCMAPADAEAGVDIEVPHEGRRQHTIDVFGGFHYWGRGLAAGFRYGIPLIPQGPIKSINNAFFLTIGADLYFIDNDRDGYWGLGLGIPIMVHWEFYFTDRWSAFAELGPNIVFDDQFFAGDGFYWTPAWIAFAVGGQYHIGKDFGLVLRVGTPYVSFGVQFAL
mgnify:FL=1